MAALNPGNMAWLFIVRCGSSFITVIYSFELFVNCSWGVQLKLIVERYMKTKRNETNKKTGETDRNLLAKKKQNPKRTKLLSNPTKRIQYVNSRSKTKLLSDSDDFRQILRVTRRRLWQRNGSKETRNKNRNGYEERTAATRPIFMNKCSISFFGIYFQCVL